MRKIAVLFFNLLVIAFGLKAQSKKYFPPSLPGVIDIDSSNTYYYHNQLSALNEPVIFTDTSKNEIYRFTWLRSFHHPVVIRIERHHNDYVIYWKMSDGEGGYKPGKLIVDSQRSVSKQNWDEFIKRLRTAKFGATAPKKRLKTSSTRLNTVVEHTDGSQWILEEKSNGKYRAVDKWSPKPSTSYYKCCDFLIELTGLKIPIVEKY